MFLRVTCLVTAFWPSFISAYPKVVDFLHLGDEDFSLKEICKKANDTHINKVLEYIRNVVVLKKV